MISLAVDTSQDRAQILIWRDQTILGEVFWDKAKSHSEKISSAFSDLLKSTGLSLSDIKKIVCVQGPGSFTGLRVGVNFCRSLAFSLNCPVVAINTLDLFALNSLGQGLPRVSVLDAQKNSVFLASYDSQLSPQLQNQVVPISKLDQILKEPHLVCGPGFETYRDYIGHEVLSFLKVEPDYHHSDLKNLLKKNPLIALEPTTHWNNLIPLYIKSSAPEEKLKPTTF